MLRLGILLLASIGFATLAGCATRGNTQVAKLPSSGQAYDQRDGSGSGLFERLTSSSSSTTNAGQATGASCRANGAPACGGRRCGWGGSRRDLPSLSTA